MASLISGFEYDIFISYRQKDNKYDGWVTEFVANLRKELEATFKEDISIYFDENPHDGLLESYNVGKSLEGKLNCLLFIPIISQTYCDPKSFAWQYEFCAFNRLAAIDPFGRDIRLTHGNVASRILPVKIHELDADDKQLLESELGSVLRSIDFIYSSAGVNRSLTPSDNPEKNGNKTFYRDQINKVANAVKEIITGLRQANRPVKDTRSASPLPSTRIIITPKKRKILALTAMATLIVLLAGYFIFNFSSLGKRFHPKPVSKFIAVLPFKNLNEIPANNFICNALSEDILLRISKVAGLKVISATTAYSYKNSDKPAKQISKELGVRYILDGSLLVSHDDLRITAVLTDAENDEVIWSDSYDRTMSGIFKLQSEVAQSVVRSLSIKLNKEESAGLEKVDEFSLEAYDSYKQGMRNLDNEAMSRSLDTSIPYFEKALALDSTLYLAYTAIANSYLQYITLGRAPRAELYSKVVQALNKSEAINNQSSALYAAKASLALNLDFDAEAFKMFNEKAIKLDPNNPTIYMNQAMYFAATSHYQQARGSLEKCLELNPAGKSTYLYYTGYTYFLERKYEEALAAFDKLLRADPASDLGLWGKGLTYIELRKYREAIETFHKRMAGTFTNWSLAKAHAKLGEKEEVEKILQYNLDKAKLLYVPPVVLAHIYLAKGDKEQACEWLRKYTSSLDGGINWLMQVKLDPRMDELKGHPCYDEIMRKMPLQ